MIKIYVSSIAKYNEGILNGEWLNLPMGVEKLENKIKQILNRDEEYFITDYEAPFEIGEHIDIFDLNETMQEVKKLNIDNDEFIALCKSHTSFDYKEVLYDIYNENYTILEITKEHTLEDESDAARKLYDEGLLPFLKKIPEHLVDLMDWEGIWRECNIAYGWEMIYIENSGRQFVVNIK